MTLMRGVKCVMLETMFQIIVLYVMRETTANANEIHVCLIN